MDVIAEAGVVTWRMADNSMRQMKRRQKDKQGSTKHYTLKQESLQLLYVLRILHINNCINK